MAGVPNRKDSLFPPPLTVATDWPELFVENDSVEPDRAMPAMSILSALEKPMISAWSPAPADAIAPARSVLPPSAKMSVPEMVVAEFVAR